MSLDVEKEPPPLAGLYRLGPADEREERLRGFLEPLVRVDDVLCGALDYAECRGWRAAIAACRWAVDRASPARQLSIITVSSSRPGMVPAHSPRREYVGVLSAIGAVDRPRSIESRTVVSRHYAESTPHQPAEHGLGDG